MLKNMPKRVVLLLILSIAIAFAFKLLSMPLNTSEMFTVMVIVLVSGLVLGWVYEIIRKRKLKK